MGHTKAALIIGGSGSIGTHLALRLRDSFKVFATYRSHPIRIPGVTALPFTVENRNWAKRVVYTAQPDVIIYVAGSNGVAWAETSTREAEQVHTGGPANVSNVADILQPKFIYLSNCHVFDGSKGNYHESDTVLPATALGKAKLGGENFIRGKSLNYVIIRSCPVIGRGNGLNLSFLDRLRMSLDLGGRIELPSGEIHSFAPVDGLTELVSRVAESGLRNKILHYGGLTKLSYVELGKAFARRFGYDPELVVASRAQPMTRAKAPGTPIRVDSSARDYSLNSTLTAETMKIRPYQLEESLDLLERKIRDRALSPAAAP